MLNYHRWIYSKKYKICKYDIAHDVVLHMLLIWVLKINISYRSFELKGKVVNPTSFDYK